MSNGWCVSFIIGLCPKLFCHNGSFMFPKEEAEKIAKELHKANPKIDFLVRNLMPKEDEQ